MDEKVYVEFEGPIQALGLLSGPLRSGFFEWVERVRYELDVVILTPWAKTDDGVINLGLFLHRERNAWLKQGGQRDQHKPLTLSVSHEVTTDGVVLSMKDLRNGWDHEDLSAAALKWRFTTVREIKAALNHR